MNDGEVVHLTRIEKLEARIAELEQRQEATDRLLRQIAARAEAVKLAKQTGSLSFKLGGVKDDD